MVNGRRLRRWLLMCSRGGHEAVSYMLGDRMANPQFRELSDIDPALSFSPMIRGIEQTFAYIAEKGPIGLTPSGALKRVFVDWAAEAFDWPGYRPADLYAVNKVLNELDFFPLMELHDIMLALKIGRHFRKEFSLTSAGKAFVGRPGKLFGVLAPFYLFRVDHGRHSRLRDATPPGNWGIFLNVINVEAEGGVSGARLHQALYGEPADGPSYDPIMSSLCIQVLRPLCWLGLLQVAGEERMSGDSVYAKTPLWHATLRLDTDATLRPIVKH